MKTRKEIIEKRKKLRSMAINKVSFSKGDKRVYTPRVCCICARPLASLIVRQNTYVSSHNHIRYHLGGFVKLDACQDIKSCYHTLREKGELAE